MSNTKKKLASFIILPAFVLFPIAGCDSAKGENVAEILDTPGETGAKAQEEAISDQSELSLEEIGNAEKSEDTFASFDSRDPNNTYDNFRTEPIDGTSEHWAKALHYMDNIGKSVGEISEAYNDWEYTENPYSAYPAKYYKDISDGMYYYINDTDKTLQGDEICSGIVQSMGFFFPDASFPTKGGYEVSQRYLEEYLGLRFRVDEYTEYYNILFGNKLELYLNGNTGSFMISKDSACWFRMLTDKNCIYYKELFGFVESPPDGWPEKEPREKRSDKVRGENREDPFASFDSRDPNNRYNNFETEFMDLSNSKHWEQALPHIESLGKPVKEISINYGAWEFTENSMRDASFEYYTDPATGVCYAVDDSDGGLQGDEVCYWMEQSLDFFFPDVPWPTEGGVEESARFLEEYLGIGFWVREDLQYWSVLFGNRFAVWINGFTSYAVMDGDSRCWFGYLDDTECEYYKNEFGFK
jgi:hypothetical protein